MLPGLTPVTCGCVAGVVAPAMIVTLAGLMVIFDGSALMSETVSPPAGAAAVRLTA